LVYGVGKSWKIIGNVESQNFMLGDLIILAILSQRTGQGSSMYNHIGEKLFM